VELTLTRPDDWHLHLRDDAMLAMVAPHTARQFARAVVMPNLVPPVTTTDLALEYRARIAAAAGPGFTPLMTLYLTDATSPDEIRKAKDAGMFALKLYPAGATTNSASGVTDLAKVAGALTAMAECGLPLLVHGEVTDPDVDVFDREAVFIERHLAPLVAAQPELKVVLEHVTTSHGVDFVLGAGDRVAGTLTAHHLLWNRGAIFAGGLNPHAYCLPVLKRERHREALVNAATGPSGRFFLGTDSAPHPRHGKEAACGCAGIFTAHAALELYAAAFERAGALDRLEAFASLDGPRFHGLAPNEGTVTLVKQDWKVPPAYPYEGGEVVPMMAGGTLGWRLKG
jgi:dihydroorotase